MLWIIKYGCCRTGFHNAACVHNSDLVGNLGHYSKIMGDKD
jgi:hypothetical protein